MQAFERRCAAHQVLGLLSDSQVICMYSHTERICMYSHSAVYENNLKACGGKKGKLRRQSKYSLNQ